MELDQASALAFFFAILGLTMCAAFSAVGAALGTLLIHKNWPKVNEDLVRACLMVFFMACLLKPIASFLSIIHQYLLGG